MQLDPLADFERRTVTIASVTHDVFVTGTGPAVLVLPEMPGITPPVADCARRLAQAGFSTWVPSLFGEPGRPFSNRYLAKSLVGACVSRQFLVFARDKRAPKVNWLRELGRRAHQECGGPGIGVIGMCFTGNFALALAVDERVKVPVMSQPSLPLGRDKASAAALHVEPKAMEQVKRRTTAEDLCVLGMRFSQDPLSPSARFESLRRELGSGFIGVDIDSTKGNEWGFTKQSHSVTSVEWSSEPANPTAQAWTLIVDHLTQKLLDR